VKFIAIIIIGMLVLAGVGVAATGAMTGTATQPSQPSVFTFDIPAAASHGGGTLMINLAEHTFVFDGQGVPGRTYYLQYKLAGLQGVHQIASAVTNPSGSLHMEGVWTKKFGTWATKLANMRSTHTLGFAAATTSDNESETLTAQPTFVLTTTTSPVVANLTAGFGGAYMLNFIAYERWYLDANKSSGNIVRYHLEVFPSIENRTKTVLYDGPSPLGNSGGLYTVVELAHDYYIASLTVYDSAGSSDAVNVKLIPS
jgi:hypothetical protein